VKSLSHEEKNMDCGFRNWLPIASVAACSMLSATALGQEYPSRLIRIVTVGAPGATHDITPRLIASKMSERLGWKFIVENQPGGNFVVGPQNVAQAPADGYTLLVGVSSMALVPITTKNYPIDFLKEFIQITRFATGHTAFIANTDLPAKNLQELIAYSKANPGKLSYASAGSGTATHLVGELLKMVSGLDMTNIPYKTSTFNNDVMTGVVPLGITTVASAAQLVKAGKLRAIAILSPTHSDLLPDVPTSADAGYPDAVSEAWYGYMVKAGTSKEIVDRLNREIVATIKLPEVQNSIRTQGNAPVWDTPEEFRRRFSDDMTKWSNVVRKANIRLE
jgi:tripartite-type tricarboxylate transporter receptor subunit TctC